MVPTLTGRIMVELFVREKYKVMIKIKQINYLIFRVGLFVCFHSSSLKLYMCVWGVGGGGGYR